MKTSKNTHFTIYFILVLLAITAGSCGSKKKTKSATKYSPHPIKCMDSSNNSISGASIQTINLYLFIDQIEVNGVVHVIKKEIKQVLGFESELIVLNEKFAVKIFHSQRVEYGKSKHFFHCDFLNKTSDCWSILGNTSQVEIKPSSKTIDEIKQNIGSFSTSRSCENNTTCEFGVRWSHGWIN